MAKGKQEPLVIASKAKDVLRKLGVRTGGDALDGLNGYVYWLLQQGAKRAKENKRETVRAHDFIIG